MMKIDVIFDGQEYTFRTNDNGYCLYVGIFSRQISCQCRFNKLSFIKKFIREYLRARYYAQSNERYFADSKRVKYPRIHYKPDNSNWQK